MKKCSFCDVPMEELKEKFPVPSALLDLVSPSVPSDKIPKVFNVKCPECGWIGDKDTL